MEKLKMHSTDFVDQNIEKIAELFPHCVTEIKEPQMDTDKHRLDKENIGVHLCSSVVKKVIDWDLLKQELSTHIVEGPQERYRLDWPGKREALLTAAPIAKTLRPCREESVDFDSTENLFIEGDNLDALKLLQETYLGKVKMIYIDPPYNTGKDFIYKDDFRRMKDEYLEESGQKDEAGNRLVANTDSNGRFHSDWLSMMYPRLKLARNLLRDDGVIFISIDDNEVHNLRKMCDEIFGAENFVAELIWERAYAPKNDAKFISNSHDYVLMYSKEISSFTIGRLPRSEAANARYKNPDNDPRGVWKPSDISVKTYNADCDYPITTPSGRVVEPPAGRCWRLSKKAFLERLEDNRIWFGPDGNSVPSMKRFLTELKFDGMAPTSILFYKKVGHSQEGAKELVLLFEGKGHFDGPKPVRLLSRLLTLANTNPDDILLDFFAGSATTAHAVMQLNAEDGGKRKFIMVQLPEETDEKSEAFKAGYKTIAEISKERIRRAGKKIKEENQPQINTDKHGSKNDLFTTEEKNLCSSVSICGSEKLDTGFRVLKVDSSNMADVYYTPDAVKQKDLFNYTDNIKDDRTSEDLLFQVLMDWGVDLTLPITREIITTEHTENTEREKNKNSVSSVCSVVRNEVFFVDGNALAACFVKDGEITEDFCKELAKRQPLRVVFRDSGFQNDSVKINVEQIFKLMSPHTEVKTI